MGSSSVAGAVRLQSEVYRKGKRRARRLQMGRLAKMKPG